MADRIALDKYYGEVIHVDGKCWQFIGLNDENITHTSGDVSAIFADCTDCLGGVNPIVPPSGTSMLLGDVHYVYGKPSTILASPVMASLNVDDNSSDNEIVWWTHTEGGVEYVIKYAQQEFAYTSGGRSIDQVVVSASDGSVSDTYTISAGQTATLRNGGFWLNGGVSGLGTAMEYNITERLISQSECVEILTGDFALFNLSVFPASGFNAIDEYGGALWYIWKKAETFASVPINTASSAGMDGIGLFLSGLDGYTARSQFETTPSSVRETFNTTTANAVLSRLNELAAIDGAWVADWDPLTNDPLDCPSLNECGSANGNPTMLLTMSWTDADVTKNYLNCDWTNGEQKVVYTNSVPNYDKTQSTMGGCIGIVRETWKRSTMGDQFALNGLIDFAGGFYWAVRNTYGGVGTLFHGTGVNTPIYSNLQSLSPGPATSMYYPFGWPFLQGPFGGATGWPYPTTGASGCLTTMEDGGYIKSGQFTGFVTFTNGVTVSWLKGTGW
jgi:hypothetical protein